MQNRYTPALPAQSSQNSADGLPPAHRDQREQTGEPEPQVGERERVLELVVRPAVLAGQPVAVA